MLYKRYLLAGLLGASAFIHAASEEKSSEDALKLLSYNICVEGRTFDSEFDIKQRFPGILEVILKQDPDIICLQEVRSKVAEECITGMLCDAGYRIHYATNNGGEMSLGLLTAHKPGKVFCESSLTQWFSETPNECSRNEWYAFGRIFTALKFRNCLPSGMPDTTQEPLLVINTHLGMAEAEKEYSAQKLIAYMAGFKQAVLVADMNFFDDKNGAAQRAMYTDAGMHDLLANEPPTFVGYSYDKFIPATKAEMSKLDGAFVKGLAAATATVLLYDGLKDDLSNRDQQPSDHLPIVLELTR